MAFVFSSIIASMSSKSHSHPFNGRRSYSFVLIPNPLANVLYKGNPGRGTRMLSPGLAMADIDISKAHEHPETIITSSALISLPTNKGWKIRVEITVWL